ncbi:MAG: DUF721 domain-containing protein [Alphaproteobacteria bacterium GM7ARS4]|nr:DUF721 domain-containing protein [Alphaproteobacteria bacterium GM7ARS4]
MPVPSYHKTRARIRPQQKHMARGLLALGIVSRQLTTPLDKKFHALLATLRSQWPHIVGHTIAQHTMPERIYVHRHRKKTILKLLVTPMMATQYYYERQHILQWINAYGGGYQHIDDIHMTPTRIQQFTHKTKGEGTSFVESRLTDHRQKKQKDTTEQPHATLTPKNRTRPPSTDHIRDHSLRDALDALYAWSHKTP